MDVEAVTLTEQSQEQTPVHVPKRRIPMGIVGIVLLLAAIAVLVIALTLFGSRSGARVGLIFLAIFLMIGGLVFAVFGFSRL